MIKLKSVTFDLLLLNMMNLMMSTEVSSDRDRVSHQLSSSESVVPSVRKTEKNRPVSSH